MVDEMTATTLRTGMQVVSCSVEVLKALADFLAHKLENPKTGKIYSDAEKQSIAGKVIDKICESRKEITIADLKKEGNETIGVSDLSDPKLATMLKDECKKQGIRAAFTQQMDEKGIIHSQVHFDVRNTETVSALLKNCTMKYALSKKQEKEKPPLKKRLENKRVQSQKKDKNRERTKQKTKAQQTQR